MKIEELYNIFQQFPSVETDTRKIKKDDIFFALKGPNFNGNLYVKQAFDAGASYCVCDEQQPISHNNIIYTDDVLITLQALAKYHRMQFENVTEGRQIPFIAITGSNGKTTTKELVHEVLSTKYKCYTTKGNLNNHIGVPLTILSIKKDAEIAVIEMGANHLHEIAGYCEYARPTHGLITNCGKAHLEGFGSEEGVRQGKGELYKYLEKTNGTIFINTDYDYLNKMSTAVDHKISYGSIHATYSGKVKEDNRFLKIEVTSGADIGEINTQLAGNYNLPNVMSAVCIGKSFGVPDALIKSALEEYAPSNSRSQIIEKDTNTILLDAYNANPSSMKVAIENFAAMQGKEKIVILGGMKELGEDSITEHTELLNQLQKHHWFKVAVAGKDYQQVPQDFLHFITTEELTEWFRKQDFKNKTILVKGSRGMAMEKVIE